MARTLDALAAQAAPPAAAQVQEIATDTAPYVLSPAPVAEREETALKPAAPASAGQPAQVESTVRLNVTLLDSLMTLAGELVLGRNQLNEAVRKGDKEGISAGAYRVSLVTSELQGAVSLTRMQPVSSLFAKFPRLVRDLAGQLGKEVQLKLEGGEVELDKTIIEGLSDPLTHMVRNSVDHGIESPAARTAAKKPRPRDGSPGGAAPGRAGGDRNFRRRQGAGGGKDRGVGGGERHDYRRAAAADVGLRQAGADFHAGRFHRREAQQRVRPRASEWTW